MFSAYVKLAPLVYLGVCAREVPEAWAIEKRIQTDFKKGSVRSLEIPIGLPQGFLRESSWNP